VRRRPVLSIKQVFDGRGCLDVEEDEENSREGDVNCIKLHAREEVAFPAVSRTVLLLHISDISKINSLKQQRGNIKLY
jgi:quercetin dioxygenase-like cupin family protein